MFYSLEININKSVSIIIYDKLYHITQMCDQNMWDVFHPLQQQM